MDNNDADFRKSMATSYEKLCSIVIQRPSKDGEDRENVYGSFFCIHLTG